jgi:molecular chaperone HscC
MIIGIDLGTTHSLATVWQDGKSTLVLNSLGEVLTPSVVGLDNDGSILVGKAAKERLQTHPELTVAGFKRTMGTAKIVNLGKKQFRAEELSSLVLRSLKADVETKLGFPVKEAVVTVPAYFSDAQRVATRNAGLLAGFEQISLLNEPTGAALAYGLHQQDSETKFLVFDLGGGTFDVSVLEMFDGVMEVKATAGDNHLGGEDIDAVLAQQFLEKTQCPKDALLNPVFHAVLMSRIEVAKRALSIKENANVSIPYEGKTYALDLTAIDLDQAMVSFLERLRAPVERAMRDSKLHASELSAVVLVGGSTRLNAVRNLVTKMFGRFPETTLNPDEVVARGAAIQAGLKMKDASLSERVMTDTCPYSLGIEVSREIEAGRQVTGFMSTVLERNTVIPASRVQRFVPIEDNQKVLQVSVYQGEARLVRDNIKLGEFELPLPAGLKTEVGADVRFTYNVNGLLEVQATPVKNGVSSGAVKQLVIENSSERLSPEEIQKRLAELNDIKIHPRDRMEVRALLARCEKHHGQLLGTAREHLAARISFFESMLETQDDRRIAPAKKTLIELAEEIEADRFTLNI